MNNQNNQAEIRARSPLAVLNMLRARRPYEFGMLDNGSLAFITAEIKRKLEAGWSEVDIVKFLGVCEDLNADVTEDNACAIMAEIQNKYERS